MIRVIIERRCIQGKEAKLKEMLLQMRSAAMRHLGYISGETLRSTDDPSVFLVIGTWTTVDSWKRWETTPERWEIAGMMEPLLAAAEKVSVYTFEEENA